MQKVRIPEELIAEVVTIGREAQWPTGQPGVTLRIFIAEALPLVRAQVAARRREQVGAANGAGPAASPGPARESERQEANAA